MSDLHEFALRLVGSYAVVQLTIDEMAKEYVQRRAPWASRTLRKPLGRLNDDERSKLVGDFNQALACPFDYQSWASTFRRVKDIRDGIAHHYAKSEGGGILVRERGSHELTSVSETEIEDCMVEAHWLVMAAMTLRERAQAPDRPSVEGDRLVSWPSIHPRKASEAVAKYRVDGSMPYWEKSITFGVAGGTDSSR